MTDRERKFKIIRLSNFLPLSETESRHEPSTCPTRYRLGISGLVAEPLSGGASASEGLHPFFWQQEEISEEEKKKHEEKARWSKTVSCTLHVTGSKIFLSRDAIVSISL